MDLALREGYYNLTIFHEATNSIQHASQIVKKFLWVPEVHYRVQMSPSLYPLVNQMSHVHTYVLAY